MIRLFVLFGVVSVHISCGPKPMADSVDAVAVKNEIPEKEICFLYFEITKQSPADRIEMTQKQVVKGFLKENTIVNLPKKEGRFYLELTDDGGHVREVRVIENPLRPVLESYDIEETTTHELELEKGYFNIRFNDHPEITQVKIYIIHQGIPMLLHTQKI